MYDVIVIADGENFHRLCEQIAMARKLRISLHMFMDEENNPAAMICINQDPSQEDIYRYLESIKIHDVESQLRMIQCLFYK